VVGLVTSGTMLAAVGSHGGKDKLGSRSGAVPLHHRAGVWQGWSLKVTAVKLHSFQLLGKSPKETPAGRQDAMVSLSVRYGGAGYGNFRVLLRRLYVSGGSSSTNYRADGGDLNCATARGVPSATPLNERSTLVFAGHYARGHLCFLIPRVDAKMLALYVDKPGCNTAGPGADNCEHWRKFALRP